MQARRDIKQNPQTYLSNTAGGGVQAYAYQRTTWSHSRGTTNILKTIFRW